MKKTYVTIPVIILICMLVFAGCSKKKTDVPDPVTGEVPYISAIIISNGKPTSATSVGVGINDMSLSGIGISGAVVKVNGMVVPDRGSGSYTLLLTENPITSGATVSISVTCAAGDFNVTAVMPASGEQTKVDFPGCYTGSYIALGNNI